MEELKTIMQKFVASGWDLIAIPAQQWLDGKSDKESLISAIKQADEECGSCGCELDPLYAEKAVGAGQQRLDQNQVPDIRH